MVRSWLSRSHSGLAEVGGLVLLYVVYEVVRGAGDTRLDQALDNTASIVALEKHLHVFGEQAVQHAAESVSFLPALLGFAYMALHFFGTAAVLVWLYRRRPDSFPLIRTTMVLSTGLALVGYRLFPAAPPRLADLGFSDTVSSSTGLNLSSDALGALYNPIAAVPSLHFGYALIVGAAVAALARRRTVRLLGAVYPLVMLVVIVATGNHFFLDAALGGVVALVAWLTARLLAAPAESSVTPHLGVPAH
jgi:PAP2 superfamily